MRREDLDRDAQARELRDLLDALLHRFGVQDQEQVCCHGISMSDYRALHFMRTSKDLTIQGLADSLRLTKSGATRVVNRLEQKRYARRERNTSDGRVCCVYLTKTGASVLDHIDGNVMKQARQMLEDVDEAMRDQVLTALRTLDRAARRRPASGVC